MKNSFNLYSEYYDLLYNDKNYEDEVLYVIKSLKKFNHEIGTILNLGSGTGRHDEVFTKHGYSIFGIELSESMAHLARSKGLQCHVGDMTNFNLNQKFNTIISLFHVISYLNKNEDLLQMFKCVSSHLLKDGFFLFDVWFTPAVYNNIPEIRFKDCENEILKIHRKAIPEIDYIENLVKVNYDVIAINKENDIKSSFSEIHSMRHFSVIELEYFGKINGLVLICQEEFLTSNALSKNTWGACFIFKKL
jgi:SAM-dependent methyltransferase